MGADLMGEADADWTGRELRGKTRIGEADEVGSAKHWNDADWRG